MRVYSSSRLTPDESQPRAIRMVLIRSLFHLILPFPILRDLSFLV
jgi:hypothetical protein